MQALVPSIITFVVLLSSVQAQSTEDVLQVLSEKRSKQRAIFNSQMEKANRIAIAELTKIAKFELRKDHLANAITAWQSILEIDPDDGEARRELEKLKQALKGMPAKRLGVDDQAVGVEFNGAGFIQTSANYAGDVPVVVVEAIVVPRSIGKSQSVIGNFHSGGLGIEIMIHNGSPKWTFSCRDGNDYKKAYSQHPVALNKIVHVSGVKNGNFIALFVDGARQGDWIPISGFKASRFPFLIGADPNQNGQPERMFTGFVDSVRVMQSRDTLPQDYRPRLPLATNRFCSLMLELNEGNGTTAIDTSPSQKNSVLNGVKWETMVANPE